MVTGVVILSRPLILKHIKTKQMKTGERKTKQKTKAGYFNVNELHDWVIGGNIPDERIHLCPTFIKPYQFAPVKQRRIF